MAEPFDGSVRFSFGVGGLRPNGTMEPTTTTGRRFPADSTLDRFIDVLVDARRRRALAILADRTSPIDLEVLARDVAGVTGADTAAEAVEQIALELHHHHLPKLEDVGLLEYDPGRRLVEVADDTDRIEPCLELARRFSTET